MTRTDDEVEFYHMTSEAHEVWHILKPGLWTLDSGLWTLDDGRCMDDGLLYGHEILSHGLRIIFGMSESRNAFLVKLKFLDNANVTQ